jgi:hypothetical protein
MATECPHCFRTVIPLKDGTCPACRQNAKQPPAFPQGLEALWIGEKVKLPDVRCTCGEPCQRTVTVGSTLNYTTRAESRSQTGDEGGFVVRVFGRLLFGRLFVALFRGLLGGGGGSGNGAVCVQVKMRQCRPCSRKKALEPQTVDYDYHKMRFVVSEKFVLRFIEINAERRDAADSPRSP